MQATAEKRRDLEMIRAVSQAAWPTLKGFAYHAPWRSTQRAGNPVISSRFCGFGVTSAHATRTTALSDVGSRFSAVDAISRSFAFHVAHTRPLRPERAGLLVAKWLEGGDQDDASAR